MTAVSQRSSTAIVVALSLLQPLPALAQSPSSSAGAASGNNRNGPADRRPSGEICAEAMSFDGLACELHILSLDSAEEADAPVIPDAADAADGVPRQGARGSQSPER